MNETKPKKINKQTKNSNQNMRRFATTYNYSKIFFLTFRNYLKKCGNGAISEWVFIDVVNY